MRSAASTVSREITIYRRVVYITIPAALVLVAVTAAVTYINAQWLGTNETTDRFADFQRLGGESLIALSNEEVQSLDFLVAPPEGHTDLEATDALLTAHRATQATVNRLCTTFKNTFHDATMPQMLNPCLTVPLAEFISLQVAVLQRTDVPAMIASRYRTLKLVVAQFIFAAARYSSTPRLIGFAVGVEASRLHLLNTLSKSFIDTAADKWFMSRRLAIAILANGGTRESAATALRGLVGGALDSLSDPALDTLHSPLNNGRGGGVVASSVEVTAFELVEAYTVFPVDNWTLPIYNALSATNDAGIGATPPLQAHVVTAAARAIAEETTAALVATNAALGVADDYPSVNAVLTFAVVLLPFSGLLAVIAIGGSLQALIAKIVRRDKDLEVQEHIDWLRGSVRRMKRFVGAVCTLNAAQVLQVSRVMETAARGTTAWSSSPSGAGGGGGGAAGGAAAGATGGVGGSGAAPGGDPMQSSAVSALMAALAHLPAVERDLYTLAPHVAALMRLVHPAALRLRHTEAEYLAPAAEGDGNAWRHPKDVEAAGGEQVAESSSNNNNSSNARNSGKSPHRHPHHKQQQPQQSAETRPQKHSGGASGKRVAPRRSDAVTESHLSLTDSAAIFFPRDINQSARWGAYDGDALAVAINILTAAGETGPDADLVSPVARGLINCRTSLLFVDLSEVFTIRAGDSAGIVFEENVASLLQQISSTVELANGTLHGISGTCAIAAWGLCAGATDTETLACQSVVTLAHYCATRGRSVRFAVATGSALVGVAGSATFRSVVVHGTALLLGQHMLRVAAAHGAMAVVDDATFSLLETQLYKTRPIELIRVGSSQLQTTVCHELTLGPSTQDRDSRNIMWTEAFEELRRGSVREAAALFDHYRSQYGDSPSLSRVRGLAASGSLETGMGEEFVMVPAAPIATAPPAVFRYPR